MLNSADIDTVFPENKDWVVPTDIEQWNYTLVSTKLSLGDSAKGITNVEFVVNAYRGWQEKYVRRFSPLMVCSVFILPLPLELIQTILFFVHPSSWFHTLRTSRQFYFAGKKVFYEYFVQKILSNKWTGWSHWNTNYG